MRKLIEKNIIWFLSIHMNDNLAILRKSIGQIIKNLIVFEIIGRARVGTLGYRIRDQWVPSSVLEVCGVLLILALKVHTSSARDTWRYLWSWGGYSQP